MTKDVKRMVGEIRQALDAYPREQLQEILAYVFKEYVVEGAATPTGALAMLDARTELEGLSFAELVTWLQLHLDVPELALFDVQHGRVHVRLGARTVELVAPQSAAPQSAEPPSAHHAAAAAAAAPAAAAPPAAVPAPTPAAQNSPSARNPAPMPTPAPSPSAPAAPAKAEENKADDKQDEPSASSSRFSWLEVD